MHFEGHTGSDASEPMFSASLDTAYSVASPESILFLPLTHSVPDSQHTPYSVSVPAPETAEAIAQAIKDRDRCEPFYTSNDHWYPSVARDLINRLQTQPAGPDTSAALVIGAGTLPFTLDVLPSTIVVADLHESVIDSVIQRCNFVATECESWEHYVVAYHEDPRVGPTEFVFMNQAGLVRDFESIKAAAQRVTLVPLVGNIVTKAAKAAEDANTNGKQFTFINFTNVSQYIDNDALPGRAALVPVLDQLPMHESAIICDSSLSGQQAMLYTLAEYTQ